MTATLPAVTAPVLAAAVDGLPGRLRRKLDDAVTTAAGWPVSIVDNHTVVRVDEATTVTLPLPAQLVTEPAQVTCSCLLAPNCLHRAAVLARAPIADPDLADAPGSEALATDAVSPSLGAAPPATGTGVASPGQRPGTTPAGARRGTAPAGEGPVVAAPGGGSAATAVDLAKSQADEPAPLTGEQRAAAEQLWQAGAAVLCAGVSGVGVVLRTALLQATHQARVQGLHRASALGREIAAQLHAAREHEPQFRLADLTDGVRDLLQVTRRLADPDLPAAEVGPLLGTARRRYDVRGSLRLFGLCSVPVVAESGYGGVVTYVVDRDARVWMVSDLMPGGEQRAAASAQAAVALGEAASTHSELARGGLVVSGATASDTGALGAGKAVRAVAAPGCAWTEEPLARLWATPLDAQVTRAFAALAEPVTDRPAGGDLLFLAVQVVGLAPGGVAVVTGDGLALTLAAASDHAALPYRENLAVLAGAAGLDLLIVGRPDPARPRTVHPLALAGAGLNLPADRRDHLDLGYDRLRPQHLATDPSPDDPSPSDPDATPQDSRTALPGLPVPGGLATPAGPVDPAEPLVPAGAAAPGAGISPGVGDAGSQRAWGIGAAELGGDLALRLVRRHTERVVAGGRAAQALAAADEQRVSAARLETGAGLLRALTTSAQATARDAFGRPLTDASAGFAQAWLSVAVYEQAASWALVEASWRTDLS